MTREVNFELPNAQLQYVFFDPLRSPVQYTSSQISIPLRSLGFWRIEIGSAEHEATHPFLLSRENALVTMDPPEEKSPAQLSLTVDSLTRAQRRKLQALSSRHEVSYTIGVLNMMVTTAIAVRFPNLYWIWHLARTSFYLPLRFLRFRGRKWELYLLDWCYVVTYLSSICAVLAFLRVSFGIETPLVRFNTALIHAAFAMACGPLAASLYVFRNSIVFHDVDHSTSVFIHLSPFILFWCMRWGAGHGPSAAKFKDMFMVCS